MKEQCPSLDKCPFFAGRLSVKSATDEITKKTFCYSTKEDCARYYVLNNLGREHVPENLHPIQMNIAELLVKNAKQISPNKPDAGNGK